MLGTHERPQVSDEPGATGFENALAGNQLESLRTDLF